jgi:hypothetical protein
LDGLAVRDGLARGRAHGAAGSPASLRRAIAGPRRARARREGREGRWPRRLPESAPGPSRPEAQRGNAAKHFKIHFKANSLTGGQILRPAAPRWPPLLATRGAAGPNLVKRWSNTGQTLVKYWPRNGQILVKYRPKIDQISAKHWSNFGRTLVKNRSNTGQIQVKYRSNTGQIPAKYWSRNGQILVKKWSRNGRFWSNAGQIQVRYRSNTC